ncbi:MAG: amino acid permease [Saprospiraceae bacterium]|nr:amino acid permease [Saprospiraceae bacterium]
MNELKRSLSLFDSTMIVMGSMIGSGIFIVTASVAKQVGSPYYIMLTWILTGILTIIAAVSYGELAGMMPRAGGQYVYLREAYGSLVGFLFGWTTFLVIETGLIAAVAIAFAKFTAVLFPVFNEQNILLRIGDYTFTSTQALALFVIVLLTYINVQGIKLGKWVQNIFTITKIGALLGLIFLGLVMGWGSTAWQSNLAALGQAAKVTVVNRQVEMIPLSNLSLMLSALGLAMIGPIFSSSAWNTITYTAGEIQNPSRNIPLSLFLGTLLVSVLYWLANLSYLMLLPAVGSPEGTDAFSRGIAFAANERVGTAAAEMIFGHFGATLMAVFIMISTFGCNNGIVLSGSRVYYAMAKDGLFFKKTAELSDKGVPAYALIAQCLWACLLCISGKYSDLLKYVTFATLLFYILTIGGIFILRKKQPTTERPYRAFGYPIVPAVYIVIASLICINLLLFETPISLFGMSVKPSWVGLGIVLLGIPVFYAQTKQSERTIL